MEEYTRKMKVNKNPKYITVDWQMKKIKLDGEYYSFNNDTSTVIYFDGPKSPNSELEQDDESGKLAAKWNDKLKCIPRAKSPNSKRFELEQRKTVAAEESAKALEKIGKNAEILLDNVVDFIVNREKSVESTAVKKELVEMTIEELEERWKWANFFETEDAPLAELIKPFTLSEDDVRRIVKEEMKNAGVVTDVEYVESLPSHSSGYVYRNVITTKFQN